MIRELIEQNLTLMTSRERGGMGFHLSTEQTWLFRSWHDCASSVARFLFQGDDGKIVYFTNRPNNVPATVLAAAQSPLYEGSFAVAQHPETKKKAVVDMDVRAPPNTGLAVALLRSTLDKYNKVHGFDPEAYAKEHRPPAQPATQQASSLDTTTLFQKLEPKYVNDQVIAPIRRARETFPLVTTANDHRDFKAIVTRYIQHQPNGATLSDESAFGLAKRLLDERFPATPTLKGFEAALYHGLRGSMTSVLISLTHGLVDRALDEYVDNLYFSTVDPTSKRKGTTSTILDVFAAKESSFASLSARLTGAASRPRPAGSRHRRGRCRWSAMSARVSSTRAAVLPGH